MNTQYINEDISCRRAPSFSLSSFNFENAFFNVSLLNTAINETDVILNPTKMAIIVKKSVLVSSTFNSVSDTFD